MSEAKTEVTVTIERGDRTITVWETMEGDDLASAPEMVDMLARASSAVMQMCVKDQIQMTVDTTPVDKNGRGNEENQKLPAF